MSSSRARTRTIGKKGHSEKTVAVLSRLAADENALRAAQFKEEDMEDQAETTSSASNSIAELGPPGAFAQKDAADGKPNVTDTLEKVAEDELEETAENDDRSTMPVADPDIKEWGKRRRRLLPGSVTNRHQWRLASDG